MAEAGVWQRLDLWARRLVPALLGIVALFVMAMPPPGTVLALVAPWLTLIVTYYWTLHRSDLFNPGVAFGLGLAQDLILGPWLGLNAFLFLLVYAATTTQQRFLAGRGFWLLWGGFAIISLGAEIVKYACLAGLTAHLGEPGPPALRWLATLALFPPVARLLIAVHRQIVAAA